MTLPPDFHPASRTRLLRVAAATWLLLVSAAVVVNHVALSRLAGDVRASAPAIDVALLDGRLTELELLTDSTGHEPEPLTQASFDTVRQALEERLARLEQADTEPPATTDIAHLQSRLDQLEARLKEVRQPPPPAAAPARRPPRPRPHGPRPSNRHSGCWTSNCVPASASCPSRPPIPARSRRSACCVSARPRAAGGSNPSKGGPRPFCSTDRHGV